MNTLKELLDKVGWTKERPGGIYESSYVHWFAVYNPPQPGAVVLEGPGKGLVPDPTRIAGIIVFDMGISLGKYVEQNKIGANWFFAPKAEVMALLSASLTYSFGSEAVRNSFFIPKPSTNPPPVVTEEKDARIEYIKEHNRTLEKALGDIQRVLDDLNKD